MFSISPRPHLLRDGSRLIPRNPATILPARGIVAVGPHRCRYNLCRMDNRPHQGRLGIGPDPAVASKEGPATRGPGGQGFGPCDLENSSWRPGTARPFGRPKPSVVVGSALRRDVTASRRPVHRTSFGEVRSRRAAAVLFSNGNKCPLSRHSITLSHLGKRRVSRPGQYQRAPMPTRLRRVGTAHRHSVRAWSPYEIRDDVSVPRRRSAGVSRRAGACRRRRADWAGWRRSSRPG